MHLNELPRRRLEATVRVIQDGLKRMEQRLAEHGEAEVLREVNSSLSLEERERWIAKIHGFRQSLRKFSKEFDLQEHPLDFYQVFNAELSTAWVLLENCRASQMKGYGVELDQAAKAALEEAVDRLVADVMTPRGLLRRPETTS